MKLNRMQAEWVAHYLAYSPEMDEIIDDYLREMATPKGLEPLASAVTRQRSKPTELWSQKKGSP